MIALMHTLISVALVGTQLAAPMIPGAAVDTPRADTTGVDTAIAGIVVAPPAIVWTPDAASRSFGLLPLDTPVTRGRPKAIEYSDLYYTRLTIHRWGSYVMLPLFAAEWSLGQNLLQDTYQSAWMRQTHAGVAGAIGVLFTVNTLTGAWNLWDSRDDPAGRTRRIVHTVAMLGSDAGFAWAGAIGGQARRSASTARTHRAIALGSIGLSTISTAMMWFWKG